MATQTRTQVEIQIIIDLVRQRFSVEQEYLGDSMEFYLSASQKETKSSFISLDSELRKNGDTALLRRTDRGLLLIVLKKPPYPKQRLKTPAILLLATVITVLIDGVIRALSIPNPLSSSVSMSQGLFIAALYTASLIGIIGIHELGHKVASWHHKINSSWPYFIPGIPSFLPTFGAVIRSAEPPVNRDALFDLGLSGPVAGLAITLIVSIVAVASAVVVPLSDFSTAPALVNVDYYTSFLIDLMKGSSSNNVVGGSMFYVLYFAYTLGFIITFINLFPAWQLDGGHIANSAVSPRVHMYLTYISVAMMIFIQFWLMAILILFFSRVAPSLRPLDDVSPLSNKRKMFFALTWILAGSIYVFVLYGNFWFNLQPLIH
ncbi:MAG: site-2 protease family protein [Nitrososphaerales archaeon]